MKGLRSPADCIPYRRDAPVSVKGHTETTLHVGAVGNKLDDLIDGLSAKFDTSPRVEKWMSNNRGAEVPFDESLFGQWFGSEKFQNTEYRVRGKIGAVPYAVSLAHIGCPVPISGAEIYHVTIRVPEGRKDLITPHFEERLKAYEVEFNARQDSAYPQEREDTLLALREA